MQMRNLQEYVLGYSKSFSAKYKTNGLNWILQNGEGNLHSYKDSKFVGWYKQNKPLFFKYLSYFEEYLDYNPNFCLKFKVYPQTVDVYYGFEHLPFSDCSFAYILTIQNYYSNKRTSVKENYFDLIKGWECRLKNMNKGRLSRFLKIRETSRESLAFMKSKDDEGFKLLQKAAQNLLVTTDQILDNV